MKRLILFIATAVFIILAAIPLWRYNIFIFKRAAREVPVEYKKTIKKYKIELVKFFPFSQDNALREWEEKIFKGKVVYKIEKDRTASFVKATSIASASALYYQIKLDARTKHPVISWRWNVAKFPAKKMEETLATKDEDDFAARVYVIFPAKFLLNSKVLEYIWAEKLSTGTSGSSPYSDKIKLIVARSGPNPDGKWYLEERDIITDYLKMFGKMPEHDIGAIAFMTNAEHTGTDAVSMYTDIKLGYREDKTGGGDEESENINAKKKVHNR